VRPVVLFSIVGYFAVQAAACGSSTAELNDSDGGSGGRSAGTGGSHAGTGGSSGTGGVSGTGGGSSTGGGSGTGGFGGGSGTGGGSSTSGGSGTGGASGTGGSAGQGGEGVGGASVPDAATDAAGDARPEASVDAAGEGGTCASAGSGQTCADCCASLYPPNAPELVFSNECYSCESVCDSDSRKHPPCGGNEGPAPGSCVQCAQAKFPPSHQVGGCGATCEKFLDCFRQCPTN
jgi:hypothetical protein